MAPSCLTLLGRSRSAEVRKGLGTGASPIASGNKRSFSERMDEITPLYSTRRRRTGCNPTADSGPLPKLSPPAIPEWVPFVVSILLSSINWNLRFSILSNIRSPISECKLSRRRSIIFCAARSRLEPFLYHSSACPVVGSVLNSFWGRRKRNLSPNSLQGIVRHRLP